MTKNLNDRNSTDKTNPMCFVKLNIGSLEFIWNLGFSYWNLI